MLHLLQSINEFYQTFQRYNQIRSPGICSFAVLGVPASCGNFATSCTELCLQQGSIGPTCSDSIGRMLLRNRSLKNLLLVHTEFGSEEIVGICSYAEHNTTLQRLVITGSHVDSNAAHSIFSLLAKTKSLRMLYLWGNNLNDNGAAIITKGFTSNMSLRDIRLMMNCISDTGAIALVGAFKQHYLLQDLDLSEDTITDTGGEAIVVALKENVQVDNFLGFFGSSLGSTKNNITQYSRLNKAGRQLCQNPNIHLSNNLDLLVTFNTT